MKNENNKFVDDPAAAVDDTENDWEKEGYCFGEDIESAMYNGEYAPVVSRPWDAK